MTAPATRDNGPDLPAAPDASTEVDALRAANAALQDKLAEEARAHAAERKAHAATAARLRTRWARHPPVRGVGEGSGSRLRSLAARLSAWVAARLSRLRLFSLDKARARRRRRPRTARFRVTPIAAAPPPPARPEPTPRGGRRMICVTHVLPYPARAGNEYRIARMLDWLSGHGWEILLVVCPHPNSEPSDRQVIDAAAAFENLIVCRHDGTLLHRTACGELMLGRLDGRRPRRFAPLLDEDGGDARRRQVGAISREFCPDILIELLLHLERTFEPETLLAEYVFMTRPFPLLAPTLRKVVDTIDVFSNKRAKVERFGLAEPLSLTAEEEASLLRRADLLIAIQPDEAADLRALAPAVPAVCIGVDFDIGVPAPAPTGPPVVLLVGSANPMNTKGLVDFLRFAWPLVRHELPGVALNIVGSVGEACDVAGPDVEKLGAVDDIGAAYAAAHVVINPAVAGTGLKIKTAEALCRGRPIVAWPAGFDGIAPEMRRCCHVATDWFDFARAVVRFALADGPLAGDPQDGDPLAGDRWQRDLARYFAADRIYAPLLDVLDAPR